MRRHNFLLFTAIAALLILPRIILAEASSSVMGPWFGTIVLSRPNGNISHETAVLVVDRVGSTVSGSMGRTIDQTTPWSSGRFEDGHLRFHLDAGGGLSIHLKLENSFLVGTASGQGVAARIQLKPAPGLMPHQQLQQEIALADQLFYQAFSSCDATRYASLLSEDLEFYQDRTGKTGYLENVQALRDRCSEGIRLRREVDQDSIVVNAAPGFGAIQAGIQRFYSKGEDGQERLDATARFTNVWSKQSGTWRLERVISYDHR